jgi:hypothetical protein
MAETHNIPPQVIQAVQRGNLIEAIKQLRQHKPQLGLAEAKALIEAIQAQGGVKPLAQKARDTVAAKASSQTPHTPHAQHAHPPIPAGMMDPDRAPGEVPRSSHGAGLMFVMVAFAIVMAAAFYFGH